MQRTIAKSVVLPSLAFPSLLAKAPKVDWKNKPADWPDIRKDCPDNAIALLAGHSEDAYDNLGFTVTISNNGQYKVYIDETLYGTYNSGTQCSITWSTSGITTGDDITTPSALKAHKIWIVPATAGNNITKFRCYRVASSGIEEQGVLWVHFNTPSYLQLQACFHNDNQYDNKNLVAITAKNNQLFVSQFYQMCANCVNLEYAATLVSDGVTNVPANTAFNNCLKLPSVSFKNMIISSSNFMFNKCNALENIKCSNTKVAINDYALNSMYNWCNKLKNILPTEYNSYITMAANYITDAKELKDTEIDMRGATNITRLEIYGKSNYFINGLKGLRVSNEAPFNNATAPQINVSYTGLDRNALVQLFNDLPYNVGYEVVGSPTITDGVASGFTTSDYIETEQSFNITDIFHIHIAVDNFSASGSSQFIFGLVGDGTSFGPYFGSSGTGIGSVFGGSNYWNGIASGLTVGAPLTIDFSGDGTNFTCTTTQGSYTKTSTKAIADSGMTGNYYFRLGVRYSSQAFSTGSINLNNTYVKLKGITWFRGTAAMTKTLSCVGATGTADLTADDKDIALNKGWSLTLS